MRTVIFRTYTLPLNSIIDMFKYCRYLVLVPIKIRYYYDNILFTDTILIAEY